MNIEVEPVIESLQDLIEDGGLPKAAKEKVTETIKILESPGVDKITINRVLSKLGALADNVNMQSDVRTQLFNVVSMLESY